MPTSGKLYLGSTLISGGGGSTGQEWSQGYYDGIYAAGPGTWSRPEWRTLPTVGPSEQKFIGLHAVFPEDGNFCSLTCSGDYTVDWGDGVVENFATGVQADHIYNYTDIDLAGTDAPVTIDSSIISRASHGFTDGKTVTLYNIAGVTGIVDGQIYYVVNAATDTFQVSATSGGTALTLTGSGTASLTRYKQAIVTVTPQAGQNLTALTLDVKHVQQLGFGYNAGWLDIIVGSPNFSTTGPIIGSTSFDEVVTKHLIERVRVVNLGGTNSLVFRFANLIKLKIIELSSTAAVTDMNYMFYNCRSLQTVPLFNTAAVTNMSNMFATCSGMQTVPLFNTAAVQLMGAMFAGCASLQSVPLFNTISVTDMSSMFSSCDSLQTVPLFNTISVTDMSFMFSNCPSLQSVPLFNTISVTDMIFMFSRSPSLQTVPLFNTAAVQTMRSMFAYCESLQTVPLFNTVSVLSMEQMFVGCYSLQTVPLFNTAAVTSMNSMFDSCYSLQTVPLFNTVSALNMSYMFLDCRNLQTVPLFDTSAVTNMFGMFEGCYSLQTVPLFNTAAVTSMSYMFSSCECLQTVPLFNTVSVLNMAWMFNTCRSLQTVPLFNTAAVQTINGMFNGCVSLQAIPALVVNSSSNFTSTFQACPSLARIEAKIFNTSFVVSNAKLSKTAIEEIFTNLPRVTTARTITIGTFNFGAPAVVSLSGTITSGSTTVTMASTAGLTTGMQITGSGITTAVAVTMQDTGDTVTRTAHGIANGTQVSFATIVTTTGILTYTPYFVVNSTTDTFQVSLTEGGAPIALTTDGSGTLLYGVTITAITPNTNITISIPASAFGTITTSSALLQRSIARLKNWTVA